MLRIAIGLPFFHDVERARDALEVASFDDAKALRERTFLHRDSEIGV